MSRRTSPFVRQWGWPIGLAVLTLFGLLSALLGQGGIWWALSWLALAVPMLTALWHIVRPARARRAHARIDRR
jgi:DMSO reductase anchor subunit